MGKYIRKAKTAGEVAVMEVSQSSLGVRTRAKTLALQRLQKSSASAPLATTGGGDGSYLQLRSRRLEKPPIAVQHHDSKRQKQQQHQGSKKESCGQNPNPISDSRVRVSSGSDSVAEKKEGEVDREEEIKLAGNGNDDVINYSNTNNDNNESKDFGGVEASFGENVLDIEARERFVLFFFSLKYIFGLHIYLEILVFLSFFFQEKGKKIVVVVWCLIGR
ncbi:hypothetical protein PTKIN_Ptkin09bG0222500 [Pterospermum kingtungense]